MLKKISSIKFIGINLMALYAISVAINIQFIKVNEYRTQSLALSFLFGILFIGSFAIVFNKEWGRSLLISANILVIICLGRFCVPLEAAIPFSYIFMSIIVILLFSNSKMMMPFKSKGDGRWKSILIIDDDDAILKTVRLILSSNGYAVLTAGSAEEGVQIASKQRPDLIILDVILPGMKGREACKKIKKNELTKDIPVIFLTSKYSEEDVQAEKEAGGEAHLTKPVNAKVLIATIQKVLNQDG